MIQFFITGTSSGIGKALATEALANGHLVEGISRNHFIEHKSFKAHTLDLADLTKVNAFRFKVNPNASTVVLINNAGWLGDVNPVAKLTASKIARLYSINVTAPSVLCAHFINQTAHFNGDKIIINISSGAAKHAIPSWSTYCASKAALDMFTEVMQVDHPQVQCLSIAPGIVDTPMQEEIRKTEEDNFPERARFIEYKNNNELSKPSEVATRILYFAKHPQKKPAVCFSLRDV